MTDNPHEAETIYEAETIHEFYKRYLRVLRLTTDPQKQPLTPTSSSNHKEPS